MLLWRFFGRLMAVTVAGEYGEAGILRESRIDVRQIAEHEDGAVSRFDPAGMQAIGTEASAQKGGRLLL